MYGQILTGALLLFCLSQAAAGQTEEKLIDSLMATPSNGSVEIVYNHTITNIPGKNVIGLLVKYPPGAKSGSHRHAKSAFITAYVISGAIRSQVDGGPITVYREGQSWIENPGAHHQVSENASPTESASLLATVIVDTHEVELTTFDQAPYE